MEQPGLYDSTVMLSVSSICVTEYAMPCCMRDGIGCLLPHPKINRKHLNLVSVCVTL